MYSSIGNLRFNFSKKIIIATEKNSTIRLLEQKLQETSQELEDLSMPPKIRNLLRCFKN